MALPKRVSCGWEISGVQDIANSLSVSSQSGFDFIISPIVHPRFKREFICGEAKNRNGAFTRSDLLLPSQDWGSLVCGRISPWVDVDSDIEAVRKNSEKSLSEELTYCAHLGLPAILVRLTKQHQTNLARILHNRVGTGNNYQFSCNIWIHVPLQSPSDSKSQLYNDSAGEEEFIKQLLEEKADKAETDKNETVKDETLPLTPAPEFKEDTWTWWHNFHAMCNYEKKVSLTLELTSDLPSDAVLARWLGEPIRSVIIPTHIFLSNKKGYPVLPRSHQILIQSLFKMDVQIVIKGSNRHHHIKNYHQYMDHLFQSRPPADSLISFARGYEDLLQCPLQPLMDNLESQTYEIFEKDPVKYSQYQAAVHAALVDNKTDETIVIMVVGAGRGPLVRASINAANKANKKIKVYAVEKNPNAVVTLQAQQDEQWGDTVTVVACDMRKWHPPEKADILVSELLGSFGDNELSPECLDGAQEFLKEGGISIPCSYTSYLAPLQSAKLYAEVRGWRDKDKHYLSSFETGYVVHLNNKCLLGTPQSLFTYHHPNYDELKDNSRHKCCKWVCEQDAVIHGLAGYFSAQLYKDIDISILPSTHSQGMFSWFPILFPIKDPIPVKCGENIAVHFWRLHNERSVWYEWCLTEPQAVSIHNPNGRAYSIGL